MLWMEKQDSGRKAIKSSRQTEGAPSPCIFLNEPVPTSPETIKGLLQLQFARKHENPTKHMHPFQEATEQCISRLHKTGLLGPVFHCTLQRLKSLSNQQPNFLSKVVYLTVQSLQWNKGCVLWTELRVLAATTEPWEQCHLYWTSLGFGLIS